MIIWSGRGFLIVLVLLVALFGSISILPKENAYYSFIIAAFLSGVFSWFFGNKWNKANEILVIDEKTGQKLRLRNNHTLFWIPMQYWGVILPILGIIILFQNSMILALVSAVLLLGIMIFQFIKNKPISQSSSKNFESAKTKRKYEVQTVAEKINVEAEERLQREKRKKEKEDPNRFMPK